MPTHYTTLFVTLDIGKNVNWLAAYAGFELKPVIQPLEVLSDRSGFERVTVEIDRLLDSGQYGQVVLGHEPTGIYHQGWARALAEHYAAHRDGRARPPLEYRLINPLVSKRRREQTNNGRNRKSDKIDLLAMALCLRDGQGQPAFLPSAADLQFQLWSQAYCQLFQDQHRLGLRLLAQLDRLWPGAVVNLKRFRQMHPTLEPPVPLILSRPLERNRVRAILSHCPNPHHFLALGQAGIQAFYRQHLGRCGPATAHLAFQVVSNALLPPPDIAQPLAQQLQADFQRYLALEQQLQTLADQTDSLVPGSPAEVLTTIPGVSSFLAARYLAYLGQPDRFANAAQVWAFAGFDPVIEQSGDFRRIGHISKKGSPGLRNTLYQIGFHTAQHLPAIARTKQAALKRGLGQVGATIHAASKANRLCFHLLSHQLPFDPTRSR